MAAAGLLLALAAGVRCVGALVQQSLLPLVDSYVINLDHRTDRCKCMADQLRYAPGHVFRHKASYGPDCGLKVDQRTVDPARQEAAQGLFCSNYNVWRRANGSDSEFVVIFEDDSLIKPHFWFQVFAMLRDCSQHWDYLIVDPFGKPAKGSHTCGRGAEAQQLHEAPPPIAEFDKGTHVQIVRTSYLPTLISKAEQHGAGPLDFWWRKRLGPKRAHSWRPGIAEQMVYSRFDRSPICAKQNPLNDMRRKVSHLQMPTSACLRPGGCSPLQCTL